MISYHELGTITCDYSSKVMISYDKHVAVFPFFFFLFLIFFLFFFIFIFCFFLFFFSSFFIFLLSSFFLLFSLPTFLRARSESS